MIRQSDIPPVQAGEAIGRALVNQLADAANGARVITGDETASVQMVGNVVGIGANLPAMNGDRDTLVRLRIRASSSKTPRLGPGLYYGSIFHQPTMRIKTDEADTTALAIERPTPNFTTCVLLNLAETGTKGHAIASEMDVVARFVGWTVPTGKGDSLPILAFRAVMEPFRARITAVSGTFPAWSYTCQRITGYDSSLTGAARWVTDGVDIAGVLNRAEFAPASGYPYIYGNGSNITDSSGTVDSGACVIIPIGVGAVVDVTTNKDTTGGTMVYSFVAMNSAEAP